MRWEQDLPEVSTPHDFAVSRVIRRLEILHRGASRNSGTPIFAPVCSKIIRITLPPGPTTPVRHLEGEEVTLANYEFPFDIRFTGN
jgi:hypothetical protein